MYTKAIIISVLFMIFSNNIICLVGEDKPLLKNPEDKTIEEDNSNSSFVEEIHKGLLRFSQTPFGESVNSLYKHINFPPKVEDVKPEMPPRSNSFESLTKFITKAKGDIQKYSPKYDSIDNDAKCDGTELVYFVIRKPYKEAGPCQYSGKCKVVEEVTLISITPSEDGKSLAYYYGVYKVCECFNKMDREHFSGLNCACFGKNKCSCYQKRDYIYLGKFNYQYVRNRFEEDENQMNESKNVEENPGDTYGPESYTQTIENEPMEGHPSRAPRDKITCDCDRMTSESKPIKRQSSKASHTQGDEFKGYAICARDGACCAYHLIHTLLHDNNIKRLPFTYVASI